MEQVSITNSLFSTINDLFSSLFSSIDNQIYYTLDDLVFTNLKVFTESSIVKFFGSATDPRPYFDL
ncbi:MAG: hypothetical protein ACI4VE_01185 [Clostridia bacterium]